MTPTPMESAVRRVAALAVAAGLDVTVQARPEMQSIRIVRSLDVVGVHRALYRLYTLDSLADVDDADLSARLKRSVEAMDRASLPVAVALLTDRARAMGMSWGDLLSEVKL